MIIDFTSNFISDIANPENKIELFYISLDNSRTVRCNTDILNEGYYLVEVSSNSINQGIVSGGLRFSLYNKIYLYYKLNEESELKVAASIPINQNGTIILLDFARNILHIDLRSKVVQAQLYLVKFAQDTSGRITYPVILNHKHDLSNQSTDIYSALDTIKKFESTKDVNTRVKYENTPDSVYSDGNSTYKKDPGTEKLIQLIDRDSPRPIVNSTQDLYKFSSNLLTLFGIDPESIVETSSIDYKSLSNKDFFILLAADDLLLFKYPESIEVEHSSPSGVTEYIFNITIENRTSAISTELVANNELVTINKMSESDDQVSYLLSFDNSSADTYGSLSLKLMDRNNSILKYIPWKNNYKG